MMFSDQSAIQVLAFQSPERVLRTIELLITIAQRTLNADEGSVLLVTPDKRELQFAAIVGAPTNVLVGKRLPIGHGITGMAALTQSVQIGSRAAGEIKGVEGDGEPQSIIATPLVVDDELIGVMTLVRTATDSRFSAKDGELYAMIGAIAATVILQQHLLGQSTDSTPLSDTESDKRKLMDELSRLFEAKPDAIGLVTTLLQTVRQLMK